MYFAFFFASFSFLVYSVSKAEQRDALANMTVEDKWETVKTERAKPKGTAANRRGSTGALGERNWKTTWETARKGRKWERVEGET